MPIVDSDINQKKGERFPALIDLIGVTVVATIFVVWSLVHYIAPTMNYLVSRQFLAEILTVSVISTLVTYVFMPIVTRLFGWWLSK